MNRIKRILSVLLTLLIIISLVQIPTKAIKQLDMPSDDKHSLSDYFDMKIHCDATLADSFADDVVMVIINQFESDINKSFSLADLSTVVKDEYVMRKDGAIALRGVPESVYEFDKYTCVSDAVASNISSFEDVSHLDGDINKMNVDRDSYQQILKVYLNNTGKSEVLNMISQLEKNPIIKAAQPDCILSVDPCVIPTDPQYSSSWGLTKISAPSAWSISTGSRDIKVGALDTGINDHEDFHSGNACNLGDRECFISGVTEDDVYEHGTLIAGIVGACANNGKGSVGVCWNITFVSMKAYHTLAEPGQSSSVIQSALRWATEECIRIITCSLGFYGHDDVVIRTAISNYPGLFVIAAGNASEDMDDSPSCYAHLPNVISVAASDQYDNLASFSNYGKVNVALAAPGTDIFSTTNSNGYRTASGTSVAAPFVSGVAGLILSKYPHMTTAQLKESILNSVDEVSALNNKVTTGGRLNAYAALRYAEKYALPTQGAPIQEGLYYIRNVNSGLVLSVPNASMSETIVNQDELSYVSNQLWKVKRLADGNFSISPTHNASYKLTIDNGSVNNGDWAVVRSPEFVNILPTSARWRIVPNSNGSFQLQSACSNYTKVLTVENASTTIGARCFQYAYGSSHNDQWVFEDATPITEGVYRLKNQSNSKYLGVNASSQTSGTQCATFSWSGSDSMRWQVKLDSDGNYDIRPLNAIENALTAETSNENAKTIIQGYSSFGSKKWKVIANNSNYSSFRLMSSVGNYQYALGVNDYDWCHQMSYDSSDTSMRWELEYVSPLYVQGLEEAVYRIQNVRSGLYMDVPNGATADGTQIKQYAHNGNNTMTSNQLWRVDYNWDSTYTIAPMHCANKVLKVTGANNNAPIKMQSMISEIQMIGTSPRWRILPDTNTQGSYVIASLSSQFDKVIAVEGASYLEGAGLLQYTYGSAANDRWYFIEMPLP